MRWVAFHDDIAVTDREEFRLRWSEKRVDEKLSHVNVFMRQQHAAYLGRALRRDPTRCCH